MPSSIHGAIGHMKASLRNNRDLPPVRLSNVAKEFVDNRVEINGCRASDLPVADGSAPIDEAEKEPSVEEPDIVSRDEDIHCKQFAEVLQAFESALPDKYKTRFKLQDKHTWSEVIEEATVAEMKYKKKGNNESPFGKVRGFFRSLQKRSAIIDNWLDLLPTQSQYGSLICGGIKMILRAATRMDEVKDFIFKALATIPDEVEKAQLMIDYNQDLQALPRLYNRVSSLYLTVFGILEHIITWYGQKCASRYFKAIIQQSSYEKELEGKVNEFKDVVSSVMNEALLCGMYRFQVMDARLQEILNCVYGVVLSNPRINPQTGQILEPQSTQQVQRGKAISRQSLCESVLRYDGDIPLTDLTVVMHRGTELSLEEQDRIVYVIHSEALRNWLLEPTKATLLISGHSEDFGSGTSAMSFLAAHIIQSTLQAQKNRPICLHWFTNQHRNARKDADANVHGIIRSLIGQLVHARTGFDLYFIKRSTAMAIRENDLEVLCDVFDQLIFQLPQKTVTFCVLDWLACLEYYERTEVQYLIKRLRAIARHTSSEGSLFKLLLTHPGGAFRAATLFSPEEVLDVPEGGDGNRMGFNSLMWNAKVGGNINQLALKSTQ